MTCPSLLLLLLLLLLFLLLLPPFLRHSCHPCWAYKQLVWMRSVSPFFRILTQIFLFSVYSSISLCLTLLPRAASISQTVIHALHLAELAKAFITLPAFDSWFFPFKLRHDFVYLWPAAHPIRPTIYTQYVNIICIFDVYIIYCREKDMERKERETNGLWK